MPLRQQVNETARALPSTNISDKLYATTYEQQAAKVKAVDRWIKHPGVPEGTVYVYMYISTWQKTTKSNQLYSEQWKGGSNMPWCA